MTSTKNDIADAVVALHGDTKARAAEIVDTVFEYIADSLALGREVRISRFGTFSVSDREARPGHNPRTGEAITVAASRKARFKPGKRLREELNGAGEES